jgi:hypothetical protein
VAEEVRDLGIDKVVSSGDICFDYEQKILFEVTNPDSITGDWVWVPTIDDLFDILIKYEYWWILSHKNLLTIGSDKKGTRAFSGITKESVILSAIQWVISNEKPESNQEVN